MPLRILFFRLIIVVTLVATAAASAAKEPAVPRARELSYNDSWPELRPLLDEIEPMISPDRIREYAGYELLRARHVMLAGDSESGHRAHRRAAGIAPAG